MDPTRNKELKDEFEVLGSLLYNEAWADKKCELVRYLPKAWHKSVEQLSDSQRQRLVEGMRRKLQPEPEINNWMINQENRGFG